MFQALPFEAREIYRAPLRAWIALWKRDLSSALKSAGLSFLKVSLFAPSRKPAGLFHS